MPWNKPSEADRYIAMQVQSLCAHLTIEDALDDLRDRRGIEREVSRTDSTDAFWREVEIGVRCFYGSE